MNFPARLTDSDLEFLRHARIDPASDPAPAPPPPADLRNTPGYWQLMHQRAAGEIEWLTTRNYELASQLKAERQAHEATRHHLKLAQSCQFVLGLLLAAAIFGSIVNAFLWR